MNKENLCLECKVRGVCCYFSAPIREFNVILSNQACKYLDRETGLCKDYDHRKGLYEHCLSPPEMYNVGGLPKECSYLIGHPELENNPKVHLNKVIDKIDYQDILFYNFLNLHPNIHAIYKKEKLEEMVI